MAERICPVWVGYLLASPIRKLFENPKKLLSDHVISDMTILDVGCAMGFFSIPLAKMVGSNGKIIAIDLQPKMIESLKKRAAKANVGERIETRICESNNLNIDDLKDQIDFVLAYHMVHEVPNASELYQQLFRSLKPGGKLFVAEPKGHLKEIDFNQSVQLANNVGFEIIDRPKVWRGYSALFQKS